MLLDCRRAITQCFQNLLCSPLVGPRVGKDGVSPLLPPGGEPTGKALEGEQFPVFEATLNGRPGHVQDQVHLDALDSYLDASGHIQEIVADHRVAEPDLPSDHGPPSYRPGTTVWAEPVNSEDYRCALCVCSSIMRSSSAITAGVKVSSMGFDSGDGGSSRPGSA